ncbi:peptidase M14 [Flavobacterium sp. NST-5]|uniref:Peptidase M14 n=1 Tax=Flavobacterium ichthyis TaxID=2698827 RepID=A0ABW9Z8N4_9FLAO|nr:M14 metallopeptidase family protein [Flavobacterium ichthyis]NBL65208.1 peptidase M14 [Flavobacterium ichthyis]
MDLEEYFVRYKEQKIVGRYVSLQHLQPFLEQFSRYKNVSIQGISVEKKPIFLYQKGKGRIKILIWSQMHGNESTTTKAVIDLINFLESGEPEAIRFLKRFSFYIFPMLNPDGAEKYTRVNANQIDLNRDFQNLTQPESQLLRSYFDQINPDFCFNLHDQRTIFGVEDSGKPATVSFLAPSFNENRDVNEVRKKAMSVIIAMNHTLQKYIPGQVGRFDDSFNINCVGDTFQHLKTPTILFEAGHFPNDYERETTRKYIFFSLISGLRFIYENDIVDNKIDNYFKIPQNKANFYDLIYKKIKIYYDGKQIISNFALQFEEQLHYDKIEFVSKIIDIGELAGKFGHFEFNAEGEDVFFEGENSIEIGKIGNFNIGKKVKIVNGLPKY